MDVPVVAAARLERHVVDGQAIVGARERLEVALSDEVPGKGVVLLAKTKETTVSRGVPGGQALLGGLFCLLAFWPDARV